MIRTANAPEELARTLNDAIVAIPAEYYKGEAPSDIFSWGRMKKVKQDLANIAGEKKMPLVIYLHGCGGFGWNTNQDISLLLRNGYAVLAPNSFARKYKPTSCDSMTYTGGFHRDVLNFRLAEASYAHEAAKNLPWVDKRNIFMVGFSEGGLTTAKYGRGGLAGRIILGWTCNSEWSEHNGISGPRDEPILAVVSSNDPWFRSPGSSGDCGSSMLFRRNARSVVVDVKLRGVTSLHDVQSLPEVQQEILQFLETHRRP
jgi:dienelactone hydrolase